MFFRKNLSGYNCHTNAMFSCNKMFKFGGIIKIEQLKLVFDFVHSNLPNELNNLFILNRNKRVYVR